MTPSGGGPVRLTTARDFVQGFTDPPSDEAFGQLLATCASGGAVDLRDEVILRLGQSGVRAAEMIALDVGDLQLADTPPQIRFVGKARRPRRLVPI